jgi:hypothetical protein
MEQVDKVAEAIRRAASVENGGLINYDHLAEQAIIAMRQPTDEMLEVVTELPVHHNRLDMWCAMVDVALGRIKLVKGDEDGEERG